MRKAYFRHIFSLLLFGSNGIVACYISLSSHEIVLFRTLIGSLFLLAAFLVSKQPLQKENRRDFVYLLISGISMGASWMFLYEAYIQIGVGVATLAYYCGPVLVMVLAPVLFREKLAGAKLIGLLLVLIGMYLVNQHALSQGGFSWGLLCGILSAVTYAGMVIFNKKAFSITGLKNSMYQLSISFVFVGLFTLVRQGASLSIDVKDILPILVLGVVNTGIGCYFYFSSLPCLPAQSVAICGYMEPVAALIFSILFLSERFTSIQIAGTLLILGGAAFGEFCCRKRSVQANASSAASQG